MKQLFALFLIALVSFPACKVEDKKEASEEKAPQKITVESFSWEKDGITVTALEGSPAYDDAKLTLSNVEPGANLEKGNNTFKFEVESYELGVQTADAATKGLANSGKGQHIHFIMDNVPYSALYEPVAEKELEEGNHVLLAFLARSYHESVKSEGAYLLTPFTVGDAGETEVMDVEKPHLFFSRPKGTYKGKDSEKILLDFYLLNTELAPDGNKVRATINGTSFVLDRWVPYTVEGLPVGEATFKLELLDANGQLVPSPFNPVERTIVLEEASDEK